MVQINGYYLAFTNFGYILSRNAFMFSSVMYSSYVIRLSMMPVGVSSIMRLATVCTNSWSCEVKSAICFQSFKALLNAVMDSRSKWLVGSSNIKQFALVNIIRETIQRTFSPPESTFDFFNVSSPENNIFPKNPLI